MSATTASPYPREDKHGLYVRPNPKSLGSRMFTDLWSYLLGALYSLTVLFPHWIVPVVVLCAFAWRAYRVQLVKTDFAPRATALSGLGWLTTWSFIGPDQGTSLSYLSMDFGTSILGSVLGLALVWMGGIVYRRLTRIGLEPMDVYEAFRNGLPWFIALTSPLFFDSTLGDHGDGTWVLLLIAALALVVIPWRVALTLRQTVVAAVSGFILCAVSYRPVDSDWLGLTAVAIWTALVLGVAYLFQRQRFRPEAEELVGIPNAVLEEGG